MSNERLNEAAVRVQPDWNVPKPETLIAPTWWPAALALGLTLAVWGLIVSAIVFAIGLAVFSAALAGWIGDMCHERTEP
jgi:hypothetical protein